ncbi:hypothetical protein NKJ06_22740 [Mesorhizobium sp. M0293]|uniref:hypothetical protein n=1 Tax=Mesorhizobium sp. M0293 TaxID=2956930 RepID=UPI003337628F
MNTSLSLIAAAMVLAWPAMAQERAATGPIDTQMTWSALSSQISTLGVKVDGANKRMDQLVICSKKSMLYAPGDAVSDTDGCLSPLGNIKTVVVSGSICSRASQALTKTVTCPADTTLLGCSGGPGDVSEDHEGYFVRPNGANGCEMVVGEPRCVKEEYWTYSWVFAHCAKLK